MIASNSTITRTFAVINKNIDIRMQSSSGGIFYALAKNVIDEGGIVFGAGFDKEWNVNHKACSSLDSIDELMRSKYVQSDMKNCFIQVKDELKRHTKVLFCGTPCQVYGLLLFLEYTLGNLEEYDLITVDFICHGVPSRLVWRRYLQEISNYQKIININFRDKTFGWRNFSLRIDFDNGTKYLDSWHVNPYMQGFIKNLYLRESCYECRCRGIDRKSDFTIADFWGVQEYLPELFDDKGTSIIMTHNDNGVKILNEINSEIEIYEISNELVIKSNSPVVKSAKKHPKYEYFWRVMTTDSLMTQKINSSLKISFIKRIVKKILRRIRKNN